MNRTRASISILAASIVTALPLFAGPDKAEPRPLYSSPLVHDQPVTITADLKGAKELFLVVTDGGDSFTADWANWMEPVLIKADGTKLPLTELKPKVAQVGWGKLGVNARADGAQPMKVQGQQVKFGLGAHAPSVIGFDLPPGVVGFAAKGGIDEGGISQGNGATVTFQLYAQNPGPAMAAAGSNESRAPRGVTERYGKGPENMSTFTAAEGLQATFVAGEPMVQNPTNIDVDHRGRIWTVEAVNYRSTFQKWGILRPEGDRVVILEDTNGDGTSDKETVFWQSKELQAPLGICVLPQPKGTQVIVSAAPNIWLLTDSDGDDKADKIDKLFTVGGNWDHDHEVHSFVFGPDGKFYFNFGNEGKSLKDPEGNVITDLAGNAVTDKGNPYRQGMVFRCDIVDGKAKNLETLGWNFRNNYEVAVDSFGTMWQSDNDDDGNKGVRINYVMEWGNYGYTDELTGAGWRTKRTNMESEIPLQHWYLNDPGVVPNLLQTGAGSPTGILVNEGTALGPQFTNQMIHCDAGPRTVRAYPVQKDGAGYSATIVDVLTSSDQWYRPADVAIAPDGALIVADWYDPGVGGHNMGDNVKDQIMGRIYRVAQNPPSPVPQVDVSTPAGAVAALQSPNQATQYLAWQALHQMGGSAEGELQALWKHENSRFRARALGLLTQLKGSEAKYLTAGLSDADADVRVFAVRLAKMMSTSREFDTTPLEENRELMRQVMRDPSPAVRRQIALSLSGTKDIARLWSALALQHDGKDRWYLEALGIGARGNEEACFTDWLERVGDKWNTPAGRDIIWRMRTSKTAEYLARILQDQTLSAEEKPRYLRSFDFLPDGSEKTTALVQLASLGRQSDFIAAEALQRLKDVDLSRHPEVKTALDQMLAGSRGTARFVDLVRDFKIKGETPGLLEFIEKAPASPEAIEATKALLQNEPKALAEAISGPQGAKIVEALGNTADQRAVPLLQPLILDGSKDVNLRRSSVKALTQIQAGISALLDLAHNGQFPEELRFAAASGLASVQSNRFKSDIAKLFPLPTVAGGGSMPPLAELLKKQGDAARGRLVYEKAEATCITCHRIGNSGADVGPALSEIGSKLPKEVLYEAILAPNAGISMGFETTQLEMKNGDVAVGIVRSETENEVVLAMPGGIQNRYAKADIAKREKLPISLMPAGLQALMSTQDLVDMVEYLASLKKQ